MKTSSYLKRGVGLYMDIFDELLVHDNWMLFYQYKVESSNMRQKELKDLLTFIQKEQYLDIVMNMAQKKWNNIPNMFEINKNGTNKKRVVFTFDERSNYVLKAMSFLLRKYDGLFSNSLYSFRSHTGVKHAINRVIREVDINRAYSYKADIHNYFNSVNYNEMINVLKKKMPSEERLIQFLEIMWGNPYANKDGNIIEVTKGIMAGTPIAGFMANLYLAELDDYFSKKEVIYARYSDDIIVFSDSLTEIQIYEKTIEEYIKSKDLTLNEKKIFRTVPGESIEFLGFDFCGKDVNISSVAERKIKKKLKRKMRALYRWKIKKAADDERTAKAFIRFFNKKFYDNPVHNEITWCRWYFPVITKDDKLREIDKYAIQCIRYLYTGSMNKKKFALRYADIQKMGYKSLVNNYWKYKKGELVGYFFTKNER